MKNRTEKQRGIENMRKTVFTLIELLVVIAIIAILTSILLPALNSARAKGLSIECLSKQKSLGLASSQYTLDYEDWILPSRMANNDSDPTYSPGNENGRYGWAFRLTPYMKFPGFYVFDTALGKFPRDRNMSRVCAGNPLNAKGNPATNLTRNVRFGWLGDTGNPISASHAVRKLSKLKRPSGVVDFADADNGVKIDSYTVAAPTVPMPETSVYQLAFPHLSSGNYVMFDGHGTNIKFSTMMGGRTSTSASDNCTYYQALFTKIDE